MEPNAAGETDWLFCIFAGHWGGSSVEKWYVDDSNGNIRERKPVEIDDDKLQETVETKVKTFFFVCG